MLIIIYALPVIEKKMKFPTNYLNNINSSKIKLAFFSALEKLAFFYSQKNLEKNFLAGEKPFYIIFLIKLVSLFRILVYICGGSKVLFTSIKFIPCICREWTRFDSHNWLFLIIKI